MGGRRGKKKKNKKKQHPHPPPPPHPHPHAGNKNAGSDDDVWTAGEMELELARYAEVITANRKMYYDEDEDEDEDDGDEDDVVKKRIKKVFLNADFNAKINSKIPRKFPREWRRVLSDECTGLSFCTLVNAFRERYGIVPGVNDLNEDLSAFNDNGERSNTLTLVQSVEIRKNEDSPQTLDDGGRGEGEGNNPHFDCYLMEMILTRLPLPSLIRAKSVCISWNRAIGALNVNVEADHHFVTHHISHGYHGIAFFSSSLNRWFRIPLQWRRWTWDCSQPSCSPDLYPCAAGGGLFLFVDWNSRPETSVVFNPLTKQHRVLPEFPLMYGWRPGAAVELIAGTDHFKVVTVPIHDGVLWDVDPLLYNSSTDKWTSITITGNNPTIGISWSDSHPWGSTLHNGTVYCTNSFGLHLGCCDIASGELKFLEIEGGCPSQIDCHDNAKNYDATLPALVVCSGKLILVGRLQRKAGEGSFLGRLPLIKHTLVGLWELDIFAKIKSWSLISLTPRDLLEDTVKSSDGTDFLVGASNHTDRIWLALRGSMNMLSFNINSKEWSVLPSCPAEDMIDSTPRRAFSAPLRITPYI